MSDPLVDDVMKRGPIPLSHVALKVLTIAITLVVGLKVGPRLSAHGGFTPMVGNADQNVLEDTVRAGPRVERRIAPAHFLDRLLAVRPSCRPDAVPGAGHALVLGAVASEGRSQSEQIPIVKHVPRMERGDPPRA